MSCLITRMSCLITRIFLPISQLDHHFASARFDVSHHGLWREIRLLLLFRSWARIDVHLCRFRTYVRCTRNKGGVYCPVTARQSWSLEIGGVHNIFITPMHNRSRSEASNLDLSHQIHLSAIFCTGRIYISKYRQWPKAWGVPDWRPSVNSPESAYRAFTRHATSEQQPFRCPTFDYDSGNLEISRSKQVLNLGKICLFRYNEPLFRCIFSENDFLKL